MFCFFCCCFRSHCCCLLLCLLQESLLRELIFQPSATVHPMLRPSLLPHVLHVLLLLVCMSLLLDSFFVHLLQLFASTISPPALRIVLNWTRDLTLIFLPQLPLFGTCIEYPCGGLLFVACPCSWFRLSGNMGVESVQRLIFDRFPNVTRRLLLHQYSIVCSSCHNAVQLFAFFCLLIWRCFACLASS